MIFSETYIPQVEDFDRSGKLSPDAVLRIFENIGSHHSDSVNDGIIQGSSNGIAWIFADWRVRMIRRPGYCRRFEVSTWARGKAQKSQVNRDFVLYNGESVCAIGCARFVLVDLNSGRPTGISEELMKAYDPEEKDVFGERPIRLREPKTYEYECGLAIRRSDIDFNGHVHNICYLNYAMEALPEDVYKRGDFTEFRIVYKSPLTEGMDIVLKYHAEDKKHIVGIYGSGGFKAAAEFF